MKVWHSRKIRSLSHRLSFAKFCNPVWVTRVEVLGGRFPLAVTLLTLFPPVNPKYLFSLWKGSENAFKSKDANGIVRVIRMNPFPPSEQLRWSDTENKHATQIFFQMDRSNVRPSLNRHNFRLKGRLLNYYFDDGFREHFVWMATFKIFYFFGEFLVHEV